MKVELKITEAGDYFEQLFDKQIDWDETKHFDMINVYQHDMLQNILTCEISIYLLRRSIGFCCGSHVDNMYSIRRKFIDDYEAQYEIYLYPNENLF